MRVWDFSLELAHWCYEQSIQQICACTEVGIFAYYWNQLISDRKLNTYSPSRAGLLNIKPGAQNQPGEDSKPTNWMVLETEHLDIYIYVFISFTDFPDDDSPWLSIQSQTN